MRRRSKGAGQAMVEFALVAPLFFGIVFATMDGGLLLFQITTANHAADVGATVIAGQGSNSAADTLAIQAMQSAGLGAGGLVVQYEVHMLDPNGSAQRDSNSCGGQPCAQYYKPDGTLISGNWDPSLRNVTEGQSSYIELDIDYRWQYMFSGWPTINLTAKRVIRLEPQT